MVLEPIPRITSTRLGKDLGEYMFGGDHDLLPPQELDDPLRLVGLVGVFKFVPIVSVGWGQDYAGRRVYARLEEREALMSFR